MPRVLFLALFNYPNKTAYPNTSIESAARSCSDNRGCTVLTYIIMYIDFSLIARCDYFARRFQKDLDSQTTLLLY